MKTNEPTQSCKPHPLFPWRKPGRDTRAIHYIMLDRINDQGV
jgi:hypothetical protein